MIISTLKNKIMQNRYLSIFFLIVLLPILAFSQIKVDQYHFMIDSSKVKMKEYKYPSVNYSLNSFSVSQSGFILLSVNGGVFMPQLNIWMLPPDSIPIISFSTVPKDSSSFFIIMKKHYNEIIQIIKNGKPEEEIKILKMPKGIYSIYAMERNFFYLFGIDTSGFNVWSYDGNLHLLFKSKKTISSFLAIKKGVWMMGFDNKIILYQNEENPKTILHTIKKTEGLALATDGTIFYSNTDGVFQYNGKQSNKIIDGLHGFIATHNHHLFILNQNKNSVLDITLLN